MNEKFNKKWMKQVSAAQAPQACVKLNDVKPVWFEKDPKSILCFLEAHCKKWAYLNNLNISSSFYSRFFFIINPKPFC